MKKLLFVSMLSLGMTFNTLAFDQVRFDEDTAFYHAHKDDAKAIITLLSVFNTDKGIRQAFEQHANAMWQNGKIL